MENTTKIENISDIKLDFFLRQNKKDVRVVLSPGDISWCDVGSTTKSMILYARKNLITIHDASKDVKDIIGINFFPPIDPEEIKLIKPISLDDVKKAIEEMPMINNVDFKTISEDIVSVSPLGISTSKLFNLELQYVEPEKTALEQAEEQTKAYTEEEKEKKTYKGKKRGRKKKRGPKPGAKKKAAKKALEKPTMLPPNENISGTGNTQLYYSD